MAKTEKGISAPGSKPLLVHTSTGRTPEDMIELAESQIRDALDDKFMGDENKMKKQLENIFKQYDTTGNGELGYNEFECAMVRDLNLVGVRNALRALFDKYDTDYSDTMNFKEFTSAVLGKRADIDPNTKNIVQKVKNMLIERGGANGIRSMTVVLRRLDRNGNGRLDSEELKEGLEVYGIHPTKDEMRKILAYFDRDGDGSVNVTEFLRGLRGQMAKRRIKLVKQAFNLLDKTGDGEINMDDLIVAYDASQHPEVKAGRMKPEDVLDHFLETWDKSHDGIVTWTEFLDYYKDISVSIESDDYFELMMRNAWHISGGKGAAANTSCLRVLVLHQDGSQTVEEVQNDLGLNHTDKDAIFNRLVKQGVKDIKEISLGSA
jgi:calcyphosin